MLLEKAINIFDIDDTILVSGARIKVTNRKTGETYELTPQEFNTYKKTPDEDFDFSDFQDLEIMKGGKIIDWVFNIMKRTIKKGKPVGVITARDSAKLIHDFLSSHGVRINPDYIFAINDTSLNFKGSTAQKKQQAFKKFIDMGFNDFAFFDDDIENIELAKALKQKEGIKMRTRHIKQKWIPNFSEFKK